MAFELDLDNVKVNQHAKYIDQRLFHSKVLVWAHRHTCTRIGPTAPPGPQKWLVKG